MDRWRCWWKPGRSPSLSLWCLTVAWPVRKNKSSTLIQKSAVQEILIALPCVLIAGKFNNQFGSDKNLILLPSPLTPVMPLQKSFFNCDATLYMEQQSITSLPHKQSPNLPKSGKVPYWANILLLQQYIPTAFGQAMPTRLPIHVPSNFINYWAKHKLHSDYNTSY